MPQQQDPLPESEIEAVFYHLITAQQPQDARAPEPQPEAAPQLDPEYEYEFHPQDLSDLVNWEKQTSRSFGIWLLLMSLVSLVLIPHTPFFTPVVSLFFALMSVLFSLRSHLTHAEQVIRDVEFYIQRPTFQWLSGSFTLAVSFLIYFAAVMVPYSPVPAALQSLLFLVAMNFAIYTPMAVSRVIRQRTLRRKRHLVD